MQENFINVIKIEIEKKNQRDKLIKKNHIHLDKLLEQKENDFFNESTNDLAIEDKKKNENAKKTKSKIKTTTLDNYSVKSLANFNAESDIDIEGIKKDLPRAKNEINDCGLRISEIVYKIIIKRSYEKMTKFRILMHVQYNDAFK